MTGSGLVRARGLKRIIVSMLVKKNVRARKSPWIETSISGRSAGTFWSGLVRARGLKLRSSDYSAMMDSQGS